MVQIEQKAEAALKRESLELNKCLALPLLPEWAGYLWENGRLRRLIKLLDEGEGQGYAARLVLPSPEAWQEVMQVGLKMKGIGF